MIGGIYHELSLGYMYDTKTFKSVKTSMENLFGDSPQLFKGDTLPNAITNYWYHKISRKMSKVLSSSKPNKQREYYNRTVDLTRSFCMGVYYGGRLQRMYRFTGGRSEKGALQESDLLTDTNKGSGKVSDGVARTSWMGRMNHPDPAWRATRFLKEYDVLYKTGWTIVFAVTMPYAVRLESYKNVGSHGGYGLHVLSGFEKYFSRDIRNFPSFRGKEIYGYVFESTGGYGI